MNGEAIAASEFQDTSAGVVAGSNRGAGGGGAQLFSGPIKSIGEGDGDRGKVASFFVINEGRAGSQHNASTFANATGIVDAAHAAAIEVDVRVVLKAMGRVR